MRFQKHKRPRFEREPKEFEEKVIQVNRVSKKTKGGNRIGFSVLTVVGDRKGQVGVGLGKAPDVASAIRKGFRRAKKNLIKVPMKKTTITHEVRIKKGAAQLVLKPAPAGTGVIAGGGVRAVVEAAGVRDILTKSLGSSNVLNVAYATIKGLRQMKRVSVEASNRGKDPETLKPFWERKRDGKS